MLLSSINSANRASEPEYVIAVAVGNGLAEILSRAGA